MSRRPLTATVKLWRRRTARVGTIAVVCVVVAAWMSALAATSPLAPGAYGWGNNQTGELSDGTTVTRNDPVAMTGVANVTTFAVGAVHGLGLQANGSVVAWGHNRSGQLGNGTVADSHSPVSVLGLGPVKTLAAGDAFSVAVQTDGAVLAWGNNNSGELGDGSAPTDHTTPVHVSGLGPGSGVIAVSAGESHTLALKSDGSVLAWGNNASGQLGDGSAPTDHHTPVPVSGLGPGSGIVRVAAGATFGLALKSDGTMVAWGNNAKGEMGDGGAPVDRHTPVPVHGAAGIVAIAAGWEHALALKSDGSVLSWGDGALGQLGDGSTAPRATPGPVNGLGSGSNVIAIYAAGNHSHAVVGAPQTTTSGPPTSMAPGTPTAAPPGVPGTPGPTRPGVSGNGSGRGGLPHTRTATPLAGNPATAG